MKILLYFDTQKIDIEIKKDRNFSKVGSPE